MFKHNNRFEILCSSGWCDFKGVAKNGRKKTRTLTLEDGRMVTATDDHRFSKNGVMTPLSKIAPEDTVDCIDGEARVISILGSEESEVFDVIEVNNPHHDFLVSGGIITKNCDEFAFVQPSKSREFWTSIQPVLSTGGSCIITSTPKSDEDQFAQIWKGAIDNLDEYGNERPGGVGKNNFYAIKVPWWEHPERDEAWAKTYREQLGEARFQQEMECSFVTDDETLINPLTLVRLTGIQPIYYTGTVRWFCEPQPNKTYLLALDPSLGTGGDYAAIQVFQLPEMIQIAEWQHNHTVPRAQVRVLMQTAIYIDSILRENPQQNGNPDIFWTVENNSIGEAILQIIEDTGEERFPGYFVSEKKRKGQVRRFRKGMYTTNKNKLSGCARMKSLVESGRATLNSGNLIRQLKSFVAKEATFSAKPGEHDDLVMSFLLIVRMLDVAVGWSTNVGDLREYIDDEELIDSEPMPVVF